MRRSLRLLTSLVFLAAVIPTIASPVRALGVIIVVTTASDDTFPADGMCSLRAAIIAANSGGFAGYCDAGTSGQDSIRFSLGSGVPVINVGSDLPAITGGVTINGQTGGATRIGLHGPAGGTGLSVTTGSGSALRNLVVDNFTNGINIAASGVTVTGSRIGPNAHYGIQASATTTTIGGVNSATPDPCSADCNVISGNGFAGLYLTGGGAVRGNFVGPAPTGNVASANGTGIDVNSGAWSVGGSGAGEGNVISGNLDIGIHALDCVCVVQGNLIGTTLTGSAALPNGGDGINTANSTLTLGGSNAGEGNVISGNNGYGVALTAYAGGLSSGSMKGNRVGTNANGVALGNHHDGIYLLATNFGGALGTVQDVDVGSPTAGDANVIAYNSASAVHMYGNVRHVSVRGNSMYSNGQIPIRLESGANGSRSAPTIIGPAPVRGTACAGCIVDIYADSGRLFEGSTTADGSGNWTFSGTVTGRSATATNTDALGNTSQFSNSVIVGKQPDGRIKKGSGTLVGDNVYNSTGINQTATAFLPTGDNVTFTIQNDGGSSDRYRIVATGAAATGYTVKYFHGTTNITSAVVAGTYVTPSLGVGATFAIKAKVRVASTAALGSSLYRLVTLKSKGDNVRTDTVRLIVSRS